MSKHKNSQPYNFLIPIIFFGVLGVLINQSSKTATNLVQMVAVSSFGQWLDKAVPASAFNQAAAVYVTAGQLLLVVLFLTITFDYIQAAAMLLALSISIILPLRDTSTSFGG